MFFKKLRHSRTAVVGVCCALVGAAVVPVISLAGSITGSTGDGPMVLASGQVQPTYTARSNYNVASVQIANPENWMRVGDTVHVVASAWVTTTLAANKATGFYVSLPVDSNIVNNANCIGIAEARPSVAGLHTPGVVLGPPETGHEHECYVEFNSTYAGLNYVNLDFTYRVRD